MKFIEGESLHFGELVGGSTSDLGNSEKSELCLQILQLAQKICLGFVPQLVDLDPRFYMKAYQKQN